MAETWYASFEEEEFAQRAAEALTAQGMDPGDLRYFGPEQAAEIHTATGQRHLERGGAVLVISLPSGSVNANQVEGILHHHLVSDLERTDTIPIVEEELVVGKREVEKARRQVQTYVAQVPVQQQVALREERVRIQRRQVNRAATLADIDAFKEGTIEIVETTEEPVIAKHARVVEEVVISVDVTERVETIQDTLRRTEVKVSGFEPDFQRDHVQRYGEQTPYGEMQPAYHYGHELATQDDADWESVETRARGQWPERNHRSAWEEVRDAVRYGYERVRTSFGSRTNNAPT